MMSNPSGKQCSKKLPNILDLPDEMIMEVVRKMPLEYYKSVKQVCMKLDDVVSDWSMHEILVFNSKYEIGEISNILKTYNRSIKKIVLINRTDINILLEEMVNLNKLSHIKLKQCRGSNNKSVEFSLVKGLLLSNLIRKCKVFKGLEIVDTKLDKNLWDVLEAASEKEMTTVCLKDCNYYPTYFGDPRTFSKYINMICKKSKTTLIKLKVDVFAHQKIEGKEKLYLEGISQCDNLNVLRLIFYPPAWSKNEVHTLYKLKDITNIGISSYTKIVISYPTRRKIL